MVAAYLKRYRNMILFSIFFFYLGCGITLCIVKIECIEPLASVTDNVMVENDTTTKYAILILTSPDNELRRSVIRTTWANLANNMIEKNSTKHFKWAKPRQAISSHNLTKIYFAIGTKLLNSYNIDKLHSEQMIHKDLLLLHKVEDSYKNLSMKLLHSLGWLSRNVKQLKYVIKCDDDSFVRIDRIVGELKSYGPQVNENSINQFISYKNTLSSNKGLYWGYFNGKARVYLNGKWQEKEWFLCDRYLPYALGGGYVISQYIVDYISRNMDYLSLYNSEDVSMGVWTAALDHINRVHDTRFDTEWKSRGCHNDMLIRHKQTEDDMRDMYQSLIKSNGEQLCASKKQSTVRKSYIYNWDQLPSSCCQ